MPLLWFHILWFHILWTQTSLVQSVSVCEKTNIVCLIDSSTITESNDDISQLIDNLVLKGSNEETSISIVVYGDIPKALFKHENDIILVNPKETVNIKQGRKRKQKYIKNKLNFKRFLNDNIKTKFVSLTEAVNIVNKLNPTIDKELIIFEYDQRMVTNKENCDLIEEERNKSNNIHFIINEDSEINCPHINITPDERGLIYYFHQVQENMEFIYDFSCPTPDLDVSDDNGVNIGRLSLNKHTNYINVDSIIRCNLDYGDEGELTTNSTITVIDDLDDDMTFESNEYLIVKKDDFINLPADCRFPVFKIHSIQTTETINILILYVTSPAMFEYIPNLNVKARKVKMKSLHKKKKGKFAFKSGHGPLNKKKNKAKNKARKLLLSGETLHASNGLSWGYWDSSFDINNPMCGGAPAYCFNLKVDNDGSGANAIRLLCANGNIDKRSNDGSWGQYMLQTLCCPNNNEDGTLNNFLSAFRQRVEPSQGWWYDDSAINDIQFKCSDGTILTSSNGASEGYWSEWNTCNTGKYIAAYNQMVEADQGIGDDTGLNDLQFYCYDKHVDAIYYASSDVNTGMFDPEVPTDLISFNTGIVDIPLPSWVSGSDPIAEGDLTQGDNPSKWVLKVLGSVTPSASFQLSLDLSADFDFDYSGSVWDGFSINQIRMIFYGNYYVMAKVGIEIRAWFQFMIPNIFYYEQILVFWLGFVPIVITPYMQIDLYFRSPKIGISASYEYSYRQTDFSFGVTYDAINGWQSINSFENKEETSVVSVELYNEFETDLCAFSLPLNGGINIFIGAKLYEVIKAFVLINLNSQNVITLPTLCADDSYSDKCEANVMKATITTSNTLTVSIGCGLTDAVKDLLPAALVNTLSGGVLIWEIPPLKGILLYHNQWCIALDGILSPINDLFQTYCCGQTAHLESVKTLPIGHDHIKENKYLMPTIAIVLMILLFNITCCMCYLMSSLCYKSNKHKTQYSPV